MINFSSIVMLHHVSNNSLYDSLKPYCITHDSFLQLLNFIEKKALLTLTFASLEQNRGRDKKNIVLTFDDCPRHLFDFAIPELRKRKMKAVFYVSTAHINGYNDWDAAEGRSKVELMNESEIKELIKLGMEVGSHSHHHIKLKKVRQKDSIAFELQESKEILERLTEERLLSFAYPFGSVPKGYKKLLGNAGYKYGCSIYQPFENNFALRRFIYHDGDTAETLERKLSYSYKIYRSLSDPLKQY